MTLKINNLTSSWKPQAYPLLSRTFLILVVSLLLIGHTYATTETVGSNNTYTLDNDDCTSGYESSYAESCLNVTIPSGYNGTAYINYSMSRPAGSAGANSKIMLGGIQFGDEQSETSSSLVSKSQLITILANTSNRYLIIWYSSGAFTSVRVTALSVNFSSISITSPSNNSAQTSRTVNITTNWSGLSSFQYQVDTNSDFSSPYINSTSSTNYSGNQTFATGLNYIRIKGCLGSICTNWSNEIQTYLLSANIHRVYPEKNTTLNSTYLYFIINNTLTSLIVNISNIGNVSYYNNSIVGMWSLDNDKLIGDTDIIVTDTSLIANNGTFLGNNSNNYSTGKYGFSGNFTPTKTGYLSVPHHASYNLTSSGAVELWEYSLDAYRGVMLSKSSTTSGSNGYANYRLIQGSDSKIAFIIGNGTCSGCSTSAIDTSTAPINQWTHVVGTWNSTHMMLYVDGVLKTTTAFSGSFGIPTNMNSPLKIGWTSVWTSSDDYWNGSIDEVKIYNRTLHSSDISHNYNASLHKINTGLYNYSYNINFSKTGRVVNYDIYSNLDTLISNINNVPSLISPSVIQDWGILNTTVSLFSPLFSITSINLTWIDNVGRPHENISYFNMDSITANTFNYTIENLIDGVYYFSYNVSYSDGSYYNSLWDTVEGYYPVSITGIIDPSIKHGIIHIPVGYDNISIRYSSYPGSPTDISFRFSDNSSSCKVLGLTTCQFSITGINSDGNWNIANYTIVHNNWVNRSGDITGLRIGFTGATEIGTFYIDYLDISNGENTIRIDDFDYPEVWTRVNETRTQGTHGGYDELTTTGRNYVRINNTLNFGGGSLSGTQTYIFINNSNGGYVSRNVTLYSGETLYEYEHRNWPTLQYFPIPYYELVRCRNSTTGIYRDDITSCGTGWILDGSLGYIAQNSHMDLFSLDRYINTSGYYITKLNLGSIPSGYSIDKHLGYSRGAPAHPLDITYINNSNVKVGFDMVNGGAIVYVSTLTGENIINNYDTGRQVQNDYYDTFTESRECLNPYPCYYYSWNPLIAGSLFSFPSEVVSSSFTNDSAYIITRPALWSPDNGYGQFADDVLLISTYNLSGNVMIQNLSWQHTGNHDHGGAADGISNIFTRPSYNIIKAYLTNNTLINFTGSGSYTNVVWAGAFRDDVDIGLGMWNWGRPQVGLIDSPTSGYLGENDTIYNITYSYVSTRPYVQFTENGSGTNYVHFYLGDINNMTTYFTDMDSRFSFLNDINNTISSSSFEVIVTSFNYIQNSTLVWINGTGTYNIPMTVAGNGLSSSVTMTGLTEQTYNYNVTGNFSNGANDTTNTVWLNVDTTAPLSITNLQNVTTYQSINWTWTNPVDSDFSHVMIYLDGTWVGNHTNTTYQNISLSSNTTYTISTRTVDTVGNINQTWVNQTTMTASANYTPPSPTSLSNTTGNFWVNHTWSPGSGNTTNSYNVSVNGTWTNGTTNNWSNGTVAPHGWRNITVWAWNSSVGDLSESSVSQNTQLSNNPPVQEAIDESLTINEAQYMNITITSTDLDSDTLTYATNRSDLFTQSGNNFSWLTDYTDSGTYYVTFNTTDNYSAIDSETIIITVNNVIQEFIPPTPVIVSAITGNFYINTSWSPDSGNTTDSYNLSVNSIWSNGTTSLFNNSTLSPHSWKNITVYAYNNSGSGTLSILSLTNNTQIPNNLIVLTPINSKSVNENSTLQFTLTSSDADSDSPTYTKNETGVGTLTVNSYSYTPNYTESGTKYVNFTVYDNYGSTDIEIVSITVTNIPLTVTSTTPSSNPTSYVSTSQSFQADTNRTSNHSWYLNSTLIQTNTSVTSSTYTNNTSSIGMWNITLITTDNIDTTSTTWVWTVSSVPTYSISGYVKNSSDILNNSNVSYIYGYNLTDTTGYYIIQNIENGTYSFTASLNGYDDSIASKTINGSNLTNQNFTLSLTVVPTPTPTSSSVGGGGSVVKTPKSTPLASSSNAFTVLTYNETYTPLTNNYIYTTKQPKLLNVYSVKTTPSCSHPVKISKISDEISFISSCKFKSVSIDFIVPNKYFAVYQLGTESITVPQEITGRVESSESLIITVTPSSLGTFMIAEKPIVDRITIFTSSAISFIHTLINTIVSYIPL